MGGDPFGLCGQVIEGQFRVDQPIGEGGFSVVYKGHHQGLDEPVAIKCLKLPGQLDTEMIHSFAQRFRDESRLAYRLSQGNLDIVRSITAGTTVAPSTGALVPYMVLEWLEGRSLGADFRERRARGMTGRSLEEVIALFDPAAMAVAYAHAQGVVHRDLKPGNVFLTKTREGTRLKVLDFGLAKIIGEEVGFSPSAKTVGHHTICSPSYGAPEQFDRRVGPIGPWTDVYSLGLLILEALRDKKVRTSEGLAMCAIEALDPARQPTCHALGIKVRAQVELALARSVALDTATRQEDAGVFWGTIKNAARKSGVSSGNVAKAAAFDDMATMYDPGAAAKAHDEVTRAVDRPLSELVDTAERAPAAVPRAAFRSEPPGAMDLGGTLVMEDAPPRPPAAGRPPENVSPRASTVQTPLMMPVPSPLASSLGQSPAPYGRTPFGAPAYAPPPPPAPYVPPGANSAGPSSRAVSTKRPGKKKSRAPLVIFLVLVVLGGLAAGAYVLATQVYHWI